VGRGVGWKWDFFGGGGGGGEVFGVPK
jgi:hypothetical protein